MTKHIKIVLEQKSVGTIVETSNLPKDRRPQKVQNSRLAGNTVRVQVPLSAP
jgi:hypothetical protein